jgi:hypothetical protein
VTVMINRRALGLMLATALLVLGISSPAHAASGLGTAETTPKRVFDLSDPALVEASGLAFGIRSPGVVYAQNDSGDSARFFALDARTGRTVAEVSVSGAANIDWEDLAVARAADGTPSVWLADIGDNDAVRTQIQLYRVAEPQLQSSGSPTRVAVPAAELWRLRYPDGAHDAESIVIDPVDHRGYVITKSLLGTSEVFVIPASSAAGKLQTMRLVGRISFGFTGTPGGPNPIGELTATGASMSPDGSILVVRTYTDAYFWPVRSADIAAALKARPRVIPLPAQPQGEGIAVRNGTSGTGGDVYIDSEGAGSAVYSVAFPALVAATTGRPSKASGHPSISTGRSPDSDAAASAVGSSSSSTAGRLVAVLLAAIVAIGGGALIVRRRRRSR